jgi:hypothetical protein
MLLLALAAAGPVLGPIRTFEDWAVACDNAHRWEVTSLPLTSDASDEAGSIVSIVREPGPNGSVAISIELTGEKAPSQPLSLAVDGTRIRAVGTGKGEVQLSGTGALQAATAMAAGRRMSVSGEKEVAAVSLKGLSAALRFIDADQGRAGTVTAFVARGSKPGSAVAAPTPLPAIAAPRAVSGRAPALTAALKARIMRESGCEDEDAPDLNRAPSVHHLDAKATLVLIPCGAGAYNFLSAAYVLAGGAAKRANFDAEVGFGSDGGPPLLVNAELDPRSGELSSYGKGRGVGDCGSSQRFVWDGARFRLIEARVMGECRGSTNWLTVWRARVIRR